MPWLLEVAIILQLALRDYVGASIVLLLLGSKMGCKRPFIKGESQVPPTDTPQNTSIKNFVQVVALVQRTRVQLN